MKKLEQSRKKKASEGRRGSSYHDWGYMLDHYIELCGGNERLSCASDWSGLYATSATEGIFECLGGVEMVTHEGLVSQCS